jgi:imidazolonepropionase-like amidohydrolase
MTRVVLQGASVFDGSGAVPAVADVMIDEGRIVEVGPGLDDDEMVDCSGHAVLPGFIDSHLRVMVDGQLDPMYSGRRYPAGGRTRCAARYANRCAPAPT